MPIIVAAKTLSATMATMIDRVTPPMPVSPMSNMFRDTLAMAMKCRLQTPAMMPAALPMRPLDSVSSRVRAKLKQRIEITIPAVKTRGL